MKDNNEFKLNNDILTRIAKLKNKSKTLNMIKLRKTKSININFLNKLFTGYFTEKELCCYFEICAKTLKRQLDKIKKIDFISLINVDNKFTIKII